MDKSLDQVIKENPHKFNRNKGKNLRRNNVGNGSKKNNSPLLQVSRNSSGRVTKKQTGKTIQKGRGTNKANNKMPSAGGRIVVDARNKLLAKNRLKIVDARDKLAAITKKTTGDLRQKLSSKKAEPIRNSKPLGLKTRSNQIVKPLMRDIGRSPLTRTIIGRTVENELARFSAAPIHYSPRYDLPPPQQYYSYQQPAAPSYETYNRSSAAMDCEPPPSASQRIRATEKRLEPSPVKPTKLEQGHKVYVSNLHHKVTQEDIGELFGDVGPLIRASLHRPGMAEVIYVNRGDALKAVDVYHNRQLDGLPMHCNMAPIFEARREIAPFSSSKPRIGKAHISPDIGTIHKALFNKNSASNSQIFTVTLPKKDST